MGLVSLLKLKVQAELEFQARNLKPEVMDMHIVVGMIKLTFDITCTVMESLLQ